ncbi:hypothetical protein CW704_03350 [Candidatus Bathyarchaeota archaeon]|nr:MAG: hypothetical protein CW704_03350 [Candidatus Bathyarchaeota archaeon]
MKMHRNKQGQIRVLEAFLATAVIFSALLLSRSIYVSFDSQDDQDSLYNIGLNVLVQLDREGELGRLINQRNWTEIASRLSILLPLGVSYNLTVYDEESEIINNSSISNGDLNGRNVISIEYLLVDRADFNFYVVRLQLAWMK